jgi:hypothetical protein
VTATAGDAFFGYLGSFAAGIGLNGSVVLGENVSGGLYRVDVGGGLSHLGGRRAGFLEPSDSLSLFHATYVSTTASGAVLIVERGRLWRYQSGSFQLIAGVLRPAASSIPGNQSAMQPLSIDGAVEGCNGEIYTWNVSGVLRIDAAGLIHPSLPGAHSYSVAGSCGHLYATAGYGLYRLTGTDSWTRVSGALVYPIVGSNTEGQLLLQQTSNSVLERRDPDGTLTTVPKFFSAAFTPDGYLGMGFGLTETSTALSALHGNTLVTVTRIDSVPVSPIPGDGPLGGVAIGIRAVASNAPRSNKVMVIDRGLLRVVDLAPVIVRVVAPSAGFTSPAPSRQAATSAGLGAPMPPRTAVP